MKTILGLSYFVAIKLCDGSTTAAFTPFVRSSTSTMTGTTKPSKALSMSYNNNNYNNDNGYSQQDNYQRNGNNNNRDMNRGGEMVNYQGNNGRNNGPNNNNQSFGRNINNNNNQSFGRVNNRNNNNNNLSNRGYDEYNNMGNNNMGNNNMGNYDQYNINPYYSQEQPLFGNSEYYQRRGASSEDFRSSGSSNRVMRRENLRNSAYSNYDNYNDGYNGNNGNNERGIQRETQRRIRDYTTPRERENRQQRQNEGARYGWQQQYDAERGNVRGGSSSDFRRGSAVDRIQDFLTPRDRENRQQRQNGGARYGWQQQYDVERGNVRGGSSNDFRRGRANDDVRDLGTPREREGRQMMDNRNMGRMVGNNGGGGGGDGVYDRNFDARGNTMNQRRGQNNWQMNGGGGRGQNDGYYPMMENDGYGNGMRGQNGRGNNNMNNGGYSNGRGGYYEPEIVGGGPPMMQGGPMGPMVSGNYGTERARGSKMRNSWENLRNVFKF